MLQSIAPASFAQTLKYDPAQPRDEDGQWTRTGSVRRGTSAVAMWAEPLPPTLQAAEDRIRAEPNEHVFLIRDGKPFKAMGNNDPSHVRMNDATDADLKDVVLTHNHPSGYGLSNQDGVSAAKRNMLEMRAVTATGTHSIRRTSTDWPAHFDEHIADMHNDLMVELGLQLHAGEITVAEANIQHHLLVYRRLQQQVGGFVYTFEPKP